MVSRGPHLVRPPGRSDPASSHRTLETPTGPVMLPAVSRLLIQAGQAIREDREEDREAGERREERREAEEEPRPRGENSYERNFLET